MSRSNTAKIIAGLLIISGVISGIVLALSFETVDFNEYAIKQNVITKQIDDEVFEEGLHFIDCFHDFIKFPSTWQTIQFIPGGDEVSFEEDVGLGGSEVPLDKEGYDSDIPVSTRTEDGLAVVIDLSFQYRIRKESLKDLYSEYGKNYADFISQMARSVVRDIASQFDALEFFFNRSAVSVSMESGLIGREADYYIELGSFNLRNVDLPNSFEAAIEAVEVAKQEIKKAEYEQQAAVIRANTLILEAQAQANISLIEAETAAEIAMIEAQAAADALNITLTMEGHALANLMAELGLNSTQLLTYLWIKAIQEHESAWLIIGTNTPIIIDPPSP